MTEVRRRRRRTKEEIQADLEAKTEINADSIAIIQKQEAEAKKGKKVVEKWYEIVAKKLVSQSRSPRLFLSAS